MQQKSTDNVLSNWSPVAVEVVLAAVWTAFLFALFGFYSIFEDAAFYLSGPLSLVVTVMSIRNLALRRHRLWVAILSVVLGLALCAYVFYTGFGVLLASSI